ncbi:MAG: HlyD family efflux transporter periplasmic adaptor subunit, partial [Cyanobacteria bacterium J06635_1]
LTAGAERIQAQSQVETALRDLQLAQVRVENSLIRAPISGRVLRVLTHAGETVSDTNGRGKGSVLDIANTRQMNVVAEVHETSIRQVQMGQSVLVTSRNEAFEGELTGTVGLVGNQIFKKDVLNDDPTARVDARVVEVKILLDNPDAVARLTNLQVEVEIDTSTKAALPTTHEGT